jgi:hypothetical protein
MPTCRRFESADGHKASQSHPKPTVSCWFSIQGVGGEGAGGRAEKLKLRKQAEWTMENAE